MMTAEMQHLGRRVDFSVARSHQLFMNSTHIVGRETCRSVLVGFGRFWSVSVGFGRFWRRFWTVLDGFHVSNAPMIHSQVNEEVMFRETSI